MVVSSKCISWFFHFFCILSDGWTTWLYTSKCIQVLHSCEYLGLVIAPVCFICHFSFCTKLAWVKIEVCGCTDINSFLKDCTKSEIKFYISKRMIELSQYFLINYLLLSCFSTWKLILAPSKVYHYNELCFLIIALQY